MSNYRGQVNYVTFPKKVVAVFVTSCLWLRKAINLCLRVPFGRLDGVSGYFATLRVRA